MTTINYNGTEISVDIDAINNAIGSVDNLADLAEINELPDGEEKAQKLAFYTAKIALIYRKAFGDDWAKVKEIAKPICGEPTVEFVQQIVKQAPKG